MAMGRYDLVATDAAGNVISGASVTVRVETGGTPLATLKSDRDGLVAQANPLTTDSNGAAGFYVAAGVYQITITSGSFTNTRRYVPIGLLREKDVVNLSTDTTGTIDLSTQASGNLPASRINSGTNASAATILYGDMTWDDPPAQEAADASTTTYLPTGFHSPTNGAVQRTVQSKLDEILYGTDFGIVADGSTAGLGTDNTTAFNNFMAACKAGNYKGELPRGTIRLASKPNDIDFPWDLGGKGIVSTTLLRDFNGSGTTGLLHCTAGSNGTRIHDMSIQSSSGKTAGSMISAASTSGSSVGALILENLWITTQGSDTQSASIFFDGQLKTSAPAGLRDCSLKNVHVFGSNGYSAQFSSCIGLSWHGGGIYAAGGTNAASGGLLIGGVTSVKSQYVEIGIVVCNGMNLTNCLDMKIAVAAIGTISGTSVNNDGTCSFTQVLGHPGGTVVGNWVSSGIRRPSAAFATT